MPVLLIVLGIAGWSGASYAVGSKLISKAQVAAAIERDTTMEQLAEERAHLMGEAEALVESTVNRVQSELGEAFRAFADQLSPIQNPEN